MFSKITNMEKIKSYRSFSTYKEKHRNKAPRLKELQKNWKCLNAYILINVCLYNYLRVYPFW